MSAIQVVVGLVVGGFLGALAFGLLTGRIDWRQQGCCAADPEHDLRMRTSTGHSGQAVAAAGTEERAT